MPTMQLSIPTQNIHVTKNFPSPIRITDLYKGWYKTCAKLSSHVPGIPETVGYEIARWDLETAPEVDEKWIKFRMTHRHTAEKATLVINRKGPSM